MLPAHLDVATLQSQAKARLLIFDEVQCYFGVALLLQIGNDGLTYQFGIAHHVEHLKSNRNDLRIRNQMIPGKNVMVFNMKLRLSLHSSGV